MIEQVIYFAIGSVLTALLALLFTPVLWSRAMRLTRKRLQLQVPLSMQEVLAERDQLRARHAVERLRIEQEMARVRAGKDADLIAIGRRTVEAARLAEEVAALRKLGEAQAHEIDLLTKAGAAHEIANAGLRGDLATAHADVAMLREAAEAAARDHARLSEEGEGHRASAAALIARLSEEGAALRERGEAQALQIDRLTEAGAAHETVHAGLRGDLAAAHADATTLREAAEVAARDHARLSEEGEGHRTSAALLLARLADHDTAKASVARLEAELAELRSEREADRERRRERDIGASLQSGRDRAAAREAGERIASLENETIALRQALQALEASGSSVDDAGLRESIHALGLAVAAMIGSAPREPATSAPAPAIGPEG